ncbi:hypothetical protein AVEN_151168-1 [Araneus ventricosus]|uniref:Uncharacterized protein n=1 Tax=Araneus ventricosus TaxID=182803 RepID=A0A4Y2MSD1_ARAVE|nr:hypothetical protein AVEN_151168-1 [Araneus ventricosus]
MSMNMIAKVYVCPTCGEKMVLTQRDGSDGYSWVCRKFGVNAHLVRRSVRNGSWFDESRLSIPEMDALKVAVFNTGDPTEEQAIYIFTQTGILPKKDPHLLCPKPNCGVKMRASNDKQTSKDGFGYAET